MPLRVTYYFFRHFKLSHCSASLVPLRDGHIALGGLPGIRHCLFERVVAARRVVVRGAAEVYGVPRRHIGAVVKACVIAAPEQHIPIARALVHGLLLAVRAAVSHFKDVAQHILISLRKEHQFHRLRREFLAPLDARDTVRKIGLSNGCKARAVQHLEFCAVQRIEVA